MPIHSASFICSSPDYRRCPSDNLPEVAFIGRSNVGKSSLINMLTGIKGLAKVSGTPGKTRLINHFLADNAWYIVDLPGYGFAKISKVERAKLELMIAGYLSHRKNLRAIFILIDSRLPPQTIDLEFMDWIHTQQIPFVILFTKCDKLTRNQLHSNVASYTKRLAALFPFPPEIITTSAETKLGREILQEKIEELAG